jgi:hypothetical protein
MIGAFLALAGLWIAREIVNAIATKPSQPKRFNKSSCLFAIICFRKIFNHPLSYPVILSANHSEKINKEVD